MKLKFRVYLLLWCHNHGSDCLQNALEDHIVLNFEEVLFDQLGFNQVNNMSLLDNLQNTIESKKCELSDRVLFVLK